MSRRPGIAWVLALVLLAPAALAPATGRAARRFPAHLLVYAQEWSLWPSRSAVPRGEVSVQLANRGQDAHDLRLRRLDRGGGVVGHTLGVRVTSSGALSQASWHLGAGRYLLYCSLPGHRMRGMHTMLAVR